LKQQIDTSTSDIGVSRQVSTNMLLFHEIKDKVDPNFANVIRRLLLH